MAEYIEREALLAKLDERRDYLFKENGDYDHYTNGFDEAVDKVENFPTADVVPMDFHERCLAIEVQKRFELERKRGEWVHDYNNRYGCSECMERETMSPRKLKNFCPNCGADMRGEE